MEEKRLYDLQPREELRLVVKEQHVIVKVQEGQAEIFGTELQIGQNHKFNNTYLGIFTWQGCILSILGHCQASRSFETQHMLHFLNFNHELEKIRIQRKKCSMIGPKVIVVGPTDSGKTTLARILLNYAVRSGWKPTYVDLDLGQGTITIPSCIAAIKVPQQLSVEGGFQTASQPLVLFHGTLSPSDTQPYLNLQTGVLASLVEQQLLKGEGLFQTQTQMGSEPEIANVDLQEISAGTFINTMGWVEGIGYEVLKVTIEQFQVDYIIILGQKGLYSTLQHDFKEAVFRPKIDFFESSKGITQRSRDFRRESRNKRLKQYFFGEDGTLKPCIIEISFENADIFEVVPSLSSHGTPPLVDQAAKQRYNVIRKSLDVELLQKILAVSYANSPDCIPYSNVAGFVQVIEIFFQQKILKVLSPNDGPLPSKILVCGSLEGNLI